MKRNATRWQVTWIETIPVDPSTGETDLDSAVESIDFFAKQIDARVFAERIFPACDVGQVRLIECQKNEFGHWEETGTPIHYCGPESGWDDQPTRTPAPPPDVCDDSAYFRACEIDRQRAANPQ